MASDKNFNYLGETFQLQLVNQIILFHDYIINVDLSNEQKSKIIIKLTDIDQNLIKGCDEFIQFIRLAYYIVNIISNNK